MTATLFFRYFLTRLAGNAVARKLWIEQQQWESPLWTTEMTRVLVQSANDTLGRRRRRHRVCAKGQGHVDEYGRHEYLTLDVTAYDGATWGPPTIVIEHENSPFKYKLQYCAWKLLCIEAELRVLVAYVDSNGRYGCFSSQGALSNALKEVVDAHQQARRTLSVIIGDWSAPLKQDDWSSAFRLEVLPAAG